MATLDEQLAAVKRQWEATSDPAAKAQLSQQANALRAQGANELAANQLVFGADEGAQRTQQYSSQYIPNYTAPPAATPATAPTPTIPNYGTTSTNPAAAAAAAGAQQAGSAPTATAPPPVDVEALIAAALGQQQTGYEQQLAAALGQQQSAQSQIAQLQQLIASMQPQIAPEINLDEAMQSGQAALQPLIDQAQQQVSRDADAYRNALLAQMAQSGVYGDPATRALAEAERARQEALGNLSATSQAQVADMAMRLLGLEQGRYSSQQAANQNMAQLAAALGQGAFGQQSQNIRDLLSAITARGQLNLGQQELAQQRSLAMLPYQGMNQAQLWEIMLRLIEQGYGPQLGIG